MIRCFEFNLDLIILILHTFKNIFCKKVIKFTILNLQYQMPVNIVTNPQNFVTNP